MSWLKSVHYTVYIVKFKTDGHDKFVVILIFNSFENNATFGITKALTTS